MEVLWLSQGKDSQHGTAVTATDWITDLANSSNILAMQDVIKSFSVPVHFQRDINNTNKMIILNNNNISKAGFSYSCQ